MCQDSTEGPLIDEEGQAGNEGVWFNMSKMGMNAQTHRRALLANVSKSQRLMEGSLFFSLKIVQTHFNQ